MFTTEEVDNLRKISKNYMEQYYCDEHEDEKINFYCKEENKFLCGVDLYEKQYEYKRVQKT